MSFIKISFGFIEFLQKALPIVLGLYMFFKGMQLDGRWRSNSEVLLGALITIFGLYILILSIILLFK